MDLGLPDCVGLDVCRRLKEEERFRWIPVIMLTGKSNPGDVQLAKKNGADAYFTKPFELDMLLYEVYALLRIRKKKLT